jgi:hypothetical protein
MIDPEIRRLFNELFETALRERRLALPQAVGNIKGQMSQFGMLQSGRTVVLVSELYRNELKARGAMAWDLLQEVLSDLGFSPDQETTFGVKEILAVAVHSQYDELAQGLNRENAVLNTTPSPDLENELANLKQELRARVDLLAGRLARQRAPGAAGDVFNFHGHVGAVQTGPHASATVTLNLAPPAVEQLRRAFAEVQTAAAAAPELTPDQRAEIVAVTDEVTKELALEKPNRLRLTHLAVGVAGTLQTIASLQPAYHAVKAALGAIGIMLP